MVMVRKLYNGFVKQPSKIKLNIYWMKITLGNVIEDYKTALDVLEAFTNVWIGPAAAAE